MNKGRKIPEVTIMRLSAYSRALEQMMSKGETVVSSLEIAEAVGVGSPQVRKDLAYFGAFGIRGLGYGIQDLYDRIAEITGTNKVWKVAIVGLGHLGGALVSYPGFLSRGFKVVGAFDVKDIGKRYRGLVIQDIRDFVQVAKENPFDLGIIVVPKDAAQEVADILVAGGVRAILNFAPVNLTVPVEVELKQVDLSMFLETLSYHMSQKTEK